MLGAVAMSKRMMRLTPLAAHVNFTNERELHAEGAADHRGDVQVPCEFRKGSDDAETGTPRGNGTAFPSQPRIMKD